MIDLAFSAVIETSVPLETDQLDALENLSQYCVNAALHNPEVIKRPLKVVYKANEALKEALVAICLAYSLINPRRKLRENKEFFEKNITIYQRPGNIKFIDFGQIAPDSIQAAVYWEIVEDWKLYCDKECGGIKALVDEKTNLAGLDNYIRGGDPIYEFARFHRKYTEKPKFRKKKAKFRLRTPSGTRWCNRWLPKSPNSSCWKGKTRWKSSTACSIRRLLIKRPKSNAGVSPNRARSVIGNVSAAMTKTMKINKAL